MDKFIGAVQHFIFQLTFYQNILGSFATSSPPHSMLLGRNEVTIVCWAESGPLYAQHWLGGREEAPKVQKCALKWDKSKCPTGICPWLQLQFLLLRLLGWFGKGGLIFLQEVSKDVVRFTRNFTFRKQQDGKVDINMLYCTSILYILLQHPTMNWVWPDYSIFYAYFTFPSTNSTKHCKTCQGCKGQYLKYQSYNMTLINEFDTKFLHTVTICKWWKQKIAMMPSCQRNFSHVLF